MRFLKPVIYLSLTTRLNNLIKFNNPILYTKKDRIQLMQNVSANFRDLTDMLLSYKIKYCIGVGNLVSFPCIFYSFCSSLPIFIAAIEVMIYNHRNIK